MSKIGYFCISVSLTEPGKQSKETLGDRHNRACVLMGLMGFLPKLSILYHPHPIHPTGYS